MVTYTYVGKNDTKAYFNGKLIAVEEITDKKKYEIYMTTKQYRKEAIDEMAKHYQELDNK